VALEYHCPHCRADFSSHQALTDHIGSTHHNTHPNHKFRCTTCDEAFMAEMKWLDDYEPPPETA
jgi:hypothetical protein